MTATLFLLHPLVPLFSSLQNIPTAELAVMFTDANYRLACLLYTAPLQQCNKSSFGGSIFTVSSLLFLFPWLWRRIKVLTEGKCLLVPWNVSWWRGFGFMWEREWKGDEDVEVSLMAILSRLEEGNIVWTLRKWSDGIFQCNQEVLWSRLMWWWEFPSFRISWCGQVRNSTC